MQAAGQASILLNNVWFEVQGSQILKSVDWQVSEGRRWVVLGPNGSGKTTLLKLITGYIYPSRGTVTILGEEFGHTDLRLLRARIGWVHYDLRAMIPEFMSVLDVVLAGKRGSLAYYERSTSREHGQASRALQHLHAETLISRRFSTLSTGERQRVLIARALMAEPEILLLDEPCMGLDPLSREEFLRSLDSLFANRKHLTVVTVTHHVEEITPVYEGVLILKRGRVLASGERGPTLNARTISHLYGKRCRLSFETGRYSLSFS